MIAIRSPIRIASSMSCVTKITVLLQPPQDAEELVLQPRAHDRVDGAERLVHQHHRRIGGERARDADALALPARQLARVARAVLRRVEADEGQHLVDARARSAPSSQPSRRGTVATFSAIVMCGNRPICWIT